MTQLGSLGVSALQASQEFNAALAHLKFDFSLVKIEAPAEYQGLGKSLSKRRKIDAEGGSSHVTARKLGALFEDAIPETPHIFQAYGRRVTQIAQTPQYNPKGTRADGPFADHVGADGTTIWAAATSGRGAIAVHLLACLLARMWKAPEAISIWTELLAQRKEAAREQMKSDTFPVNALAASQIEVRREQLAEWDASARAWLQTADEAKRFQQTQTMLILKNINLPINKAAGVYGSVMEVWTKALKTMDLLIQGMPQRIQDGAVLLALASWHIYPDMCVLGAESKMVRLNDSLVRDGGIVTIGLQNVDPERGDGIFWSLPLAHLRFYGDPVVKTASAGDQSSRVSMDQLLFVSLGSTISTWGKFGSDIVTPIRLIHDILGKLELASMMGVEWSRPILEATNRFLNSQGQEHEELSRLVQFGIRRCCDFLTAPPRHPPAMFGLTDMYLLVHECPNMDSKLECIRNASKAFGLMDNDDAIIRYFIEFGSNARYTHLNPRRPNRKRTRDGEPMMHEREVSAFLHWIGSGDDSIKIGGKPSSQELSIRECIRRQTPFTVEATCRLSLDGPYVACEFVYGDPFTAAVFRPVRKKPLPPMTNRISVEALPRIFPMSGLDLKLFGDQLAHYWSGPFYQSLRGIALALELYSRLPSATIHLRSTAFPICEMKWCISSKGADYCDLGSAFACIAAFETGELDIDPDEIKKSGTMAISCGNSIYVAERLISDPVETLPEYAIRRITGNIGKPGLSLLVPPENPKAPKPDFGSWSTVNHASFNGLLEDNFAGTSLHLSFSDYQLPIAVGKHGQRDQECCFMEAIISVYDRGQWVADVDVLKASKKWLVDDQKEASHLVHFIHEAVTSDTPEQAETFAEEVNRDKPMKNDDETLPSDWMRDIESCLSGGDMQWSFEFLTDNVPNIKISKKREIRPNCIHNEGERLKYSHLEPLVSIDSWSELLDPPLSNAIVRASNNQIARLCAATVAVQQGFNIHIIKNSTCWQCEYADCCSDEQHKVHKAALEAQQGCDSKKGGTSEEEYREDPHHLFIC
ncbi:MAG: hypothetical protein LQ338_007598 [Usnochroma carphineum]|nr:MAG: hypothetical protein LQ338_007598 [Usnochroma carphineum]